MLQQTAEEVEEEEEEEERRSVGELKKEGAAAMAVMKKGSVTMKSRNPQQQLQLQKTKKKKPPFRRKKDSRLAEAEEIEAIEARLKEGAPARGSNPLASSLEINKEGEKETEEGRDAVTATFVGAKLFEQLPVSDRTKRGLADAKFVHMTAIQRAALPHALCGRDVLGAAKTGSGKTLTFLIPVGLVFTFCCFVRLGFLFSLTD